MKPNKRQLAEFDAFFYQEAEHFHASKGETEAQKKARVLEWYTWLWEGLGCQKRFIPKPMTIVNLDREVRADREEKLPDFDQDLYPNRDWNL